MHGVHCESENSHFHPSFLHLSVRKCIIT